MEDIKKKKRDILKKKLKHGKTPDSHFNLHQLKKGMKVEKEHSDDPKITKQIAKAHIKEDPKYYNKLEKMENED